jgi:hypothetical protein
MLVSGVIFLIPFGVSMIAVARASSRVLGLVVGEAMLVGVASAAILILWPVWTGYGVMPPPYVLLFLWPVPVGMIFLLFLPSFWSSQGDGGARCPSCEYDLTGNTSGVCPECGQRLTDTR